MPLSAPPPRLALLAAFAAIYLIWGSTYLSIRVAVESFPPFLMAGTRFFLGGAALYLILRCRGYAAPTPGQWREQAPAGVLMLLGGNGIVSWAEQRVPSGLTTLILGVSPTVLVLLEWARPGGRPPTPGLWSGIAMGLAGLAVLIGPGAFPAHTRPPTLSICALLLSSVCWWLGSLAARQVKPGLDPLMAAAAQMLVACGPMVLTGLCGGEAAHLHLRLASPRSWCAFGYLVVAGSLVAFPVYVWLLKHSIPSRVSTFAYVNPVVAVLLGAWILHEPLSARMLWGAALAIGAVVVITRQRQRAAAAR